MNALNDIQVLELGELNDLRGLGPAPFPEPWVTLSAEDTH